MHILGSFSATGLTSGGIRSNAPQSTATKRSNRIFLSFLKGTMSFTPSRKPGFPSALRSAVANACRPAPRRSRAIAIMLPRESPSGLKWPETRTRFAPFKRRSAAM